MWIILLAVALSVAAWLAELKVSRILVREEDPIDAFRDLNATGAGVSRLLDR